MYDHAPSQLSEWSIAWNGLVALPRIVSSIPNDGRTSAVSHHHKLAQLTELAYLQRGEGENRLCRWKFGFGVGREEEVEVEYDGVLDRALDGLCPPSMSPNSSIIVLFKSDSGTIYMDPGLSLSHPRRIVFILTYI